MLRSLRKTAPDYVEWNGLRLPPRDQRFCTEEWKDAAFFVQSAKDEVERLSEVAGLTEGSQILDIGSGQGRLAIGLRAAMPDIRYVGIDIDSEARKLYVVDQGSVPAVYRANLDGSGFETLITTGLEHPYVGAGQIGDVDVVALAGAVAGWIVVAVHLHRAAGEQRVDHPRDEMLLGVMRLADPPGRVGAGGVEVA